MQESEKVSMFEKSLQRPMSGLDQMYLLFLALSFPPIAEDEAEEASLAEVKRRSVIQVVNTLVDWAVESYMPTIEADQTKVTVLNGLRNSGFSSFSTYHLEKVLIAMGKDKNFESLKNRERKSAEYLYFTIAGLYLDRDDD